MSERASEIEYLRYFSQNVLHELHDATVDSIKRQFKQETGKRLPADYYDPDEEE